MHKHVLGLLALKASLFRDEGCGSEDEEFVMLIASHFHDYYDIGARYGVDKTVVYRRTDYFKDSSLALPSFAIYQRDKGGRYVRGGADPINVTPFLIGFCGKVYPVIYAVPTFNAPSHFFYTPESFLEHLAEVKYSQPESRYKHSDPAHGGQQWARAFFSANYEGEKYQEIFLENKAPIYVLGERPICEGEREGQDHRYRREETLLINPRLKDYEFVKVKHPVSLEECHVDQLCLKTPKSVCLFGQDERFLGRLNERACNE